MTERITRGYVEPVEDGNPALSGAVIAILNNFLSQANVEEAYRIGVAHAVCIEARIAPDDELLLGAAMQETIWDARALAMEYVETPGKLDGI